MGEHLYLAHHGIKGMKWGVRRFQNTDGSLTSAGEKRYGVVGSTKAYFKRRRENVDRFYKQTGDYVYDKMPNQMTAKERARYEKADAQYKKAQKEAGRQYREDLKRGATERLNKAASAAQAHRREIAVAAGVTAAGIALAAYGNHRHVVNAARQEAYARYREQKGEEIARGLLADAMNNPNIVSFENAAGSFHR